jgi:glycosyltransferase involved in cell wall biosynthesis
VLDDDGLIPAPRLLTRSETRHEPDHPEVSLRILMVAPQPFFRPRGTPFSVLHRIRALLRLGHTVDLVTYPFGEVPELGGLEGLEIHRSRRPPGVRDVGIGPSPAKLALDANLFRLAYDLAARSAYDLVHTHEEGAWAGVRIRRRYGTPHLYDMHSSLPQQFANFNRFNWAPVVEVFRRFERHVLDNSDGVIAICPALRDHVVASRYAGPLAMIENSLDFDPPRITRADVDALRGRLGLGSHPAVVYTGTLEEYQGLDLLLAAAAELQRGGDRPRFVILGGMPGQLDQLKERARGLGVEPLFTFIPAVPPLDVFAYLELADVLITTRSRGTNTPLKIYQYLRAGKPIVATAIGSHTQVLNDESAELVEPTASAIAAGLRRVLTSPERRAALSHAALRLSRERYSETAYMEQLRDLLDRMPLRQRVAAAPA